VRDPLRGELALAGCELDRLASGDEDRHPAVKDVEDLVVAVVHVQGRHVAADLADDETVLASLLALRGEIADARARLDAAEAVVPSLPHRARYLRLVHRLGRRLLDVHEQWLDEVEAELGGPSQLQGQSPGHVRGTVPDSGAPD
jgi:hypothetical protein